MRYFICLLIDFVESVNEDLSVCLYRPVVTLSPLERGQGVCEFSLIDRKITHPLSPLKRGNRYSRRYVTNTKYTDKSSFIIRLFLLPHESSAARRSTHISMPVHLKFHAHVFPIPCLWKIKSMPMYLYACVHYKEKWCLQTNIAFADMLTKYKEWGVFYFLLDKRFFKAYICIVIITE